MSQLHAFLQTLTPQETAAISGLRLIGKEKEVFDLIYSHRNGELPESDEILRKLDISDTHFYKANSVLLRKAYKHFVPEEGLTLLRFLWLKGLFPLLRHEILTQDKKFDKSEPAYELFCRQCFHYIIDFPYKYYDKKLTDLFGEKYLEAKKDRSESDDLYVKYHKLFADVIRIAAKKNPVKALGIKGTELIRQTEELEKGGHHLALYYLYRSICSYYTYYEKNNGQVLFYLRKAIGLKSKISSFFPVNIGQFLDLLLADTLFRDNQIEAAFELYQKAFSEGIDPSMYGYFYHCEQYVLVSVIRKRFDEALNLLDQVFRPCIENRQDIYATRGAMCYVKLYLSMGELKQAASYLNIAKAINEKTFYLPFDVQLRVLENIYFFLKKDYDFALQLANRNIKFLRSQDQPDVLEDYHLFWKVMIALLNAIHKETEPAEQTLKEVDFLCDRYSNLYCNLIRMLTEQTVEEVR